MHLTLHLTRACNLRCDYCYAPPQVSPAMSFATGRQALELGYHEIITMAERIREPVWRQTFLEKIPEHRAIAEEKRRIDEAASRFESDQ